MGAGVLSYVLVCVVALAVSGLTLFSGFGVGTLLMPAFALLFPIEVAIAATAVVHFLNNGFKMALLWRHPNWRVAAQFLVPAASMAYVGAMVLKSLSDLGVLYTYTFLGRECEVSVVKIVIGVLIASFTVLNLVPGLEDKLTMGRDWYYLVPGGAASGFFGGLSGHQGAIRQAVLIRCGLSKEEFIATGVVCSLAVDCVRLLTYKFVLFEHLDTIREGGGLALVGAATLAAFVGAFVGRRLMKKLTMKTVHRIVGMLLMVVGFGLVTGLV